LLRNLQKSLLVPQYVAGVQVKHGDYGTRPGKLPGDCRSDSRIVQLAIPRREFSASEKTQGSR
jgi:hypothetical protein